MKFVIQRVSSASVSVGGKLISSIEKGICVLLGIDRDDSIEQAIKLGRKCLTMRLWPDEDGKMWRKSVIESNYEVLFVSQFTLCAKMKGNKPNFHCAMAGKDSQIFYREFLQSMKKTYCLEKVKDGVFGAIMDVKIHNDGPVTLVLSSEPRIPLHVQKVREEEANTAQPPSDTSYGDADVEDNISELKESEVSST
eukprot:79782_1